VLICSFDFSRHRRVCLWRRLLTLEIKTTMTKASTTTLPEKTWQADKPLFIQAPMEDVTDTVFRRVLARCGGPDIYFTEFTNVEGLCSRGRDKIIHRLQFTGDAQPLIAQIWGNNPDNYYQIACELRQMGFAGIDINMGCPERGIVKRG